MLFQNGEKEITPEYIHISMVSYGTGNYFFKVAISKSGINFFHQNIEKYQ